MTLNLHPPALPPGWVHSTLGDVCQKPEYGWTTKAVEKEDGYRLLRTTDISKGTIDWSTVPCCAEEPPSPERYKLRAGDIVISRAGSVGISALIGDGPSAVFASYLIRMRPSDGMNRKFVSYFLSSPGYWAQISEQSAGIALQNVNAKKLAAISIPIAPLPEQRRIVAEIETQFTRLDASVAALRRTQANLKRYRASVLRAACSGKLVPTEAELARAEGREYEPTGVLLERILAERRARWETQEKRRGKYREPAAPDTSDLPPLPEGWAWATLPRLGELNRGKSKHRPRNDQRLLGGDYPFVQTGDVKHSNGWITQHSQTYTEFGLAQSRLWPAGTLCITIAANIADTGILSYPACFPDSVVGFISEDLVLTKFFELFIRTQREHLEQFAPATAQKNINLQVLSALAVPLPPLAEQRRIVAEVERRLSVIQQAESAVEASLQRAERLRQSILKRAFAGELVAQDPNDEPASVLLERIRTQREAEQAAATASKKRPARRRAKTQSQQLTLKEASA